jgi:DHA2 family multidrug resistance protein-like MFS transporter
MFLDPEQRTFAIGVWATSFSVGAAIGPLLGGVLLEFLWWGSVFLLALPVMGLLLLLGPRLLPEFRDPNAGRLDLLSAGLSIVAVLGVIYGLKRIAEHGLDWPAGLSIVAGFAVALLFVQRQRRLAEPLVDLSLFRSRRFNASLASNTLSLAIAFGIFLFIAQYLQLVLGLSPLEAGLWTAPSAGGFIAGSMLAPATVRRVRPAFVVAGGLTVAALGLALLTQVEGDSDLAWVVVASVLIALGVAPPVTLGTDIIVGCVPPERAGVASGMSETGAELGGALGIALLGSIGVAVYRSEVADALPVGLGSEHVDAAKDTLGGAVEVAEGLGREPGQTVLDAAHEAFAQALQVAAVVGAIVALATAFLAVAFLRRTGTGPPPERAFAAEPDVASDAA